MKNLIKPLEWAFNHLALTYKTPINDFGSLYFISRMYDTCHSAMLYDENGWTVCEIGEYRTVNEAKAACEAHYTKAVLAMISPEARAILEQHLNSQNPTA